MTAATRKLKSRMAMQQALLGLLRERPFELIQITDITSRARVGYATFFRHYASREELLSEIAAEQISALLTMSIPVMLRASSAESCLALCRYVHERRDLWRTLLAGGAAASVRQEFVRQARAWSVSQGKSAATSVPLDLGTVCAAGSTIDALAWWLEQGSAYPVETIAGYIDKMIISPFVVPSLKTPRGPPRPGVPVCN